MGRDCLTRDSSWSWRDARHEKRFFFTVDLEVYTVQQRENWGKKADTQSKLNESETDTERMADERAGGKGCGRCEEWVQVQTLDESKRTSRLEGEEKRERRRSEKARTRSRRESSAKERKQREQQSCRTGVGGTRNEWL
jgi:hypothetical protein